MKTDLATYRKERLKSSRFLVVFVGLLAVAFPFIAVQFESNTPLMTDVTFKNYESYITVDEEGNSRTKEIVTIQLDKPQVYIRTIGELAATDKKIRFWSEPVSAKIDGREVAIDGERVAGGGHVLRVGERLPAGEHTIELTIDTKNSVYMDDGQAVFRSRILPRYSFSEVENFYGEVKINNAIEKDSLCWLSDAIRPEGKTDKCDFKEFTSEKVSVEIEDPAYLRPVRLALALDGDSYQETRLPWSGSWDDTLGRHWWTPVLALILALGIYMSQRVMRTSVSDRMLLSGATVTFAGGSIAIFFLSGASILAIPLFAVLWIAVPAYLRITEHRNLLSAEAVKELMEKNAQSNDEEEPPSND